VQQWWELREDGVRRAAAIEKSTLFREHVGCFQCHLGGLALLEEESGV